MPDLIIWKDQHINRLKRDMDHMLERMWGEFGPSLTSKIGIRPSIDLTETEDNLILKAEIPGVNPKDLEIDIADNVLTIRGETKQEDVNEGKNYHKTERSYGFFSRTLRLPCKIILDDVKATYRKGILKVVMPKRAPEETRRLRIKLK